EPRVEKHDFAGDLRSIQRGEMFETVGYDDLGGQAFVGSGYAPAERGEHDLLGSIGSLSGELHQLGRLCAADPVGNHYLLEPHIEPQAAHLRGDILDCVLSLRRAAQTRSDVVAQVSKLNVCVITRQRGSMELFQLCDELRRVRYPGARHASLSNGLA